MAVAYGTPSISVNGWGGLWERAQHSAGDGFADIEMASVRALRGGVAGGCELAGGSPSGVFRWATASDDFDLNVTLSRPIATTRQPFT